MGAEIELAGTDRRPPARDEGQVTQYLVNTSQ
jgi:hypothetical protein